MATKNTFKENGLRVVAVVGLIAVLLLGAWGIIQLAFFIPTFLSDLAGGTFAPRAGQESLTVTLPGSVAAAQAFPVSWSHKNSSGQYSYSLSYSCQDGLSAKAPLPNGTAQTVACNTPFNYINATNTTPLIFTLTGNKSAEVTVTIAATKLSSGAVTSTGEAKATVAPPVAPAPTQTPAKTPAKTTVKSTSGKYVASGLPGKGKGANLYGYPDLQVRIVANPGAVRAGSQVSLQFIIENVGTNVAPRNWTFTASLPYTPVYTFQSQGQQALYPGDKIVYTLGYSATPPNNQVCTLQYPNPNCPIQYPYYDPAQPYGGYVGSNYYYQYNQYPGYYGTTQSASVTVDPYNLVWELNESNNTAAISYQVY